MPPQAPHEMNAPIKPRRPWGACSTRNTIELVYSPPTESPCTMRSKRQGDRRKQPERRVARQEPDQEGRDRHGGDREGEGRAPAVTVADMADDHAADRPHHVADREHAERGEELGDRILVRKEMLADRGGEVAVDREIVPFEHVADHAGGDDLAVCAEAPAGAGSMSSPELRRRYRFARVITTQEATTERLGLRPLWT